MFHPNLGRFLQPDPIGFESGDNNLYRYVRNNPLNFVDPSGLAPNQQGTTNPEHFMQIIREWENLLRELNSNRTSRDFSISILRSIESHHRGNTNRYFFTDRYGWVDVRHFAHFAAVGFLARRNAGICGGVWTAYLQGYVGEIVQGIDQLRPGGSRYRSSFSSEDLPSNAAGIDFSGYIGEEDNLSEAFRRWLIDAGGRNQEDPRAGWGLLPVNDPNRPVGAGGEGTSGNTPNSNSGSEPIPPNNAQPPVQRPPRLKGKLCFPSSTLILTAVGYRPIAIVRQGDLVYGYNVNSHRILLTKVLEKVTHEWAGELIEVAGTGGRCVHVTSGHPFFDGIKWVTSENLGVANTLLTVAARRIQVKSKIIFSQQRMLVYNLFTDVGTYVAGTDGLIVSSE